MSHWLVTVSVNTLFCQVFWLTNVYMCVCVCVCMGFPDSSVGKESACNPGDPSLIPGLRRSAGEGKGYCWNWITPQVPWDLLTRGPMGKPERLPPA